MNKQSEEARFVSGGVYPSVPFYDQHSWISITTHQLVQIKRCIYVYYSKCNLLRSFLSSPKNYIHN